MRSPLVALCCLAVLGAAGAVRAQALGTDVLVGTSGGAVLRVAPNGAIATLAGPLPPLLRNTVGVLDASGGATARFDANVLGAAVSGVRVWAVAVTFDPAAPLGIGRVSAPLLFVL